MQYQPTLEYAKELDRQDELRSMREILSSRFITVKNKRICLVTHSDFNQKLPEIILTKYFNNGQIME
jgi:hypothetical protein